MELMNAKPAQIWRLLIPQSFWMFTEEVPEDELIFHYRDHIYFVNQDGSVLALPKPACFDMLDMGTLLECLATSDDTIDFDDEGEFDYGFVLKQMGYIVPVREKREKATYQIEIFNTALPKAHATRYEMKHVDFGFALYHALMRCHELNAKTDWEYEHEVKRIVKVDAKASGKVQVNL
ncbi:MULTISPECIES: hypothetical protein [Brevibacillus]|jgi:hypothetical protein|uniref:hypothetical protein n=1 Tax=Brevibacillus TaxID=55080 RepID=UPI00156AD8B3|nr:MULTISPECIES: hypothetical protein [Brevibacillus]MBU8715620.1 hypothetical protein [Brevibacillus parabrevis]MDH6352254.1 hypothetical protein [Brevibacillus sp. 1238]MDR4998879.1 hypothetical protein [Brevibacillus parabrevis]MED1722258.1 hypothetical protein [Brevibacillus parabrevis]NRQ56173.1 hypothetical protein [Brevibacillus sp. HD1.4A]